MKTKQKLRYLLWSFIFSIFVMQHPVLMWVIFTNRVFEIGTLCQLQNRYGCMWDEFVSAFWQKKYENEQATPKTELFIRIVKISWLIFHSDFTWTALSIKNIKISILAKIRCQLFVYKNVCLHFLQGDIQDDVLMSGPVCGLLSLCQVHNEIKARSSW